MKHSEASKKKDEAPAPDYPEENDPFKDFGDIVAMDDDDLPF